MPSGSKRSEMGELEKALRKEGFRPRFWPAYGKKILHALIVILLLGALVFGGKYIWEEYLKNSDVFEIRELQYSSNGIIPEKKALELMKYDGSVNLLTIDTEQLRKNLLSHSAVKSAFVQTRLPDKLSVTVDARLPVAWLHCPGAGIRSNDLEHGMFIAADTVAFSSIADVYADYTGVPVLQIPTPLEGEIRKGVPLPEWASAITLIQTLKKERKAVHAGARIIQARNGWAYKVEFDDGCIALFGVHDIPAQVERFYGIIDHALSTGRKVSKVNLLMERNIPVEFDESYENIPVAEPVEE